MSFHTKKENQLKIQIIQLPIKYCSNEYWLSSSNNGIIKSGSSYKNFKYENDTATINDDAAYGIKDIDIINKLLVNYNEFTLLDKTDDYYFNVGENPEIQQMLYRFFELSNYQNVADRNYFNDEPSKIKTSDIQKVSLTKMTKEN